MEDSIIFKIEQEYAGMTVENYLRKIHKMSHRTITRLKKDPLFLTVNGVHARTVDILKAGDVLKTVFLEDESAMQLPVSGLSLNIVYEDEHYLICDKPPFMPVHPSLLHYNNTLANAVSDYYRSCGVNRAFRPINRLDKDTSGLVVVAKNQYAASRAAFTVNKSYYCIACGIIDGDGTIDAPIKKESEDSIMRIVSPNGERAVTHYKVLSQQGGVTQLSVQLETGRTHQIRTHMKHIGHPLVGDVTYGTPDENLVRQALHCARIWFTNPITSVKIDVQAPLPEDISSYLAANGIGCAHL